MKKTIRILTLIAVLALGFYVEGIILPQPSSANRLFQDEGICDELQLILIVDQSGSMSQEIQGRKPSDPKGLRFQGPQDAVQALSFLRYNGYDKAIIRVAMVHFGSQPSLGLDWTKLTPSNEQEHRQLQQELKPMFEPIEEMGNTNVLSAFQFASSLFDQAPSQSGPCPGRAVIILTDGRPYVEGGESWPEHMADLQDYVLQYMSPPNHQIFVIGIDVEDNFWSDMKPYWVEVVGDENHVARANSDVEMATLITAFAEQSARVLRITGSEPMVECVDNGELSIPPFIQRMQLTLVKSSPDLHLDVVDVLDRPIEPSRTDLEVELVGFDEMIEKLTVNKPPPGIWEIRTMLPADAIQKCQVRLISFKGTGRPVEPTDNDILFQFKEAPVSFKVVDSVSGDPLPVYSEPKYELEVEAELVGSKNLRTINLDSNPSQQEYTGRLIPIEAGPNLIEVRAVSHNPDGSPLVVFDKPIASVEVKPVKLMILDLPDDPVDQYEEINLTFAPIFTDKIPVELDIPLNITATLHHDGKNTELSLNPVGDGSYQVAFTPDQAGDYVLAYQATVDAPPPYGPLSVGEDELTINVDPVVRIQAQVVSPRDNSYIATDPFFRPTGMDLQIQLMDEDGNAVSPGQIGASDPTQPFKIRVLDKEFKNVADNLKVTNTGKPGLFRLESNDLGPGHYEIQVETDSQLGQGYTWEKQSWTKSVVARINPWAWVVVGSGVILIGLVFLVVMYRRKIRRHPLQGHIRVFEPRVTSFTADEDQTLPPKEIFRYELPNRNRVVFYPNEGLTGLLQRIPLFGRLIRGSHEVRYIEVESPNERYAQEKQARVTITLRNGRQLSPFTINPAQEPHPINPLNYYIEKGPHHSHISTESGAMRDVSGEF